MFTLYADKTKLTVRSTEQLTSGSVNVYPVRFQFSSDWTGLERTAVFRAGGNSVSVLLNETGECVIPWETLVTPGLRLEAGVVGTWNGETVLPTVWASLGTILPGAEPGSEAAPPPTPSLWQQELARKGERLEITEDGKLGLYAGDKLLSAIPLSGTDGELPISAITGLRAVLETIPIPMTAEQLREILSR